MENTVNVDKRAVLFIAAISSFIPPFMISSINIALRSIGKEFEMGAVSMSWIAASYLLSSAVFLVPFGRIADIYGRKRIFLYGMGLFTLSSALCAFSVSEIMLIIFRVFQGIGSAMIFGTGMAILTSVYPAGEKGRVLGINTAAVYLGLSAGPFLGGFLTENLGWRSIFIVSVPLGFVVVFMVFFKLKAEWAYAVEEKFDYIGSVIYGAALIALMYGFSLLPRAAGFLLVLAGTAAIALFVLWTKRTIHPVLDLNLFFANRIFLFSTLAALINYSATYAISFLLSLYLQYIKGLNPRDAGLVLIVQPIIQAVFSPLTGRFSDRIEPGKVASAGMTLTAAGLLTLTFVNSNTPQIFIFAALVLLGFGFALFASPNTNAIMGSVDKRQYGIASGIISTMRVVGQAFSLGIATLVMALYIGQAKIIPSNYPLFITSVRTTFAIMVVLCTAGIFFSLARGKVSRAR